MSLSGLEQVALVVNVGDVPAALATPDPRVYPIVEPQNRDIEVKAAKIGVLAGVTADSNDYTFISVVTATGDCIAYLSTKAIGLTAGTFREMTLDSDKVEIEEDETIQLQVDQVSSGVGICGLTLQLEYEITA